MMRTLRQLSYPGTATLLTSLGLLAMGCSGGGISGGGASDGGVGSNGGPGGPGSTTGAGASGNVGTVAGTDGTGTTGGTATGTTGSGGTGGGGDVCVPGISPSSQIPRLLNREYDAIVNDLLGVTALASNNNQPPSALLNTDFDGPINEYTWNAYVDTADKIAAEVMAGSNRSNFISCDPATVPTCYEDTIRTFGRKAFRRPLTDEDVARFMTLTTLEPAGTPDEIAEAILYAFLASPSFITVPELAAEPEGTALRLSSHEVATRLSLMLWGSVPDDELNAAADAGLLTTTEQIVAQAQRMVQVREKAGPQIAEAHRAYLGMDLSSSHWWKVQHDPEKFPNYDQAATATLAAELDAFFEEVVFAGGSFKDLFLSNVAFVNQDTAALYGLDPSAYGTDLTRVELDPVQRPGFLTRAGFLSSFSNFDATSPILRGAFITVNIIGVNPGAPDPTALTTPIPEGDYQTRREQIEALTSPGPCATCHGAYVNPPGFALENFDAVGSWQTVDALGGPIDPTTTVTFSDEVAKPVSTPLEMMQELVNVPVPSRIYTQSLVSFFTGRQPNANDACVVDELHAKLSSGDGYSILNVVADLAQADSFRLRTVGN